MIYLVTNGGELIGYSFAENPLVIREIFVRPISGWPGWVTK